MAPSSPPSSSSPEPSSSTARPTPRVDLEAAIYPLFKAFPGLISKVPRVPLGSFPSAVEAAPNLSRLLGTTLFIKRDDLLTDVFGGGKVRKLELYFGEAKQRGKTRIVTFGGVGSNQAAATALLGKRLGFSVGLYLAPQPRSSLVTRNLEADAGSGAELSLFPSVHEAEEAFAKEAKHGDAPYAVAPGGTTPLGTLGFVSAGLELARDVRAGVLPEPKRIYIALGLGGSSAGLALGCALGKLSSEVVAVRASNPTTVTEKTLAAIHREVVAYARALDPSFPDLPFRDVHLRIDGRFVGGGYGVPSDVANRAMSLAQSEEGWELEPVYTAKALAALMADARDGSAGPVLFWSTQSSRPITKGPVPQPFQRFLQNQKG